MHTLTPQRLEALLASSEATALSADAKMRLQWIATYVRSGQSISATCDTLGIARSTFHRWLERFNPNDLSTLEEKSHEALTPRASNIDKSVAALIRGYREKDPFMGKEMISTLLKSEHSVELSASSVGRIIERDCLYFGHTPLHWRKRMQAHAKIQPTTNHQQPTTLTSFDSSMADIPGVRFWINVWSADWRRIRRKIGMVSVLANIAFAGLFLTTAYLEKKAGSTLGAQVTTEETQTLSDIDFFDNAK